MAQAVDSLRLLASQQGRSEELRDHLIRLVSVKDVCDIEMHKFECNR
jgi:hypothetical protein